MTTRYPTPSRYKLSVQAAPGPVLIIGSGRSGTTLLYNLLALHGDFAWISNLIDHTGRPQFAILNGIYRRTRWPRLRLLPCEGYRLWDSLLPRFAGADVGVLDGSHVLEQDRVRVVRMVGQLKLYSRSHTFLNKNTRNTRRVLYLDSLFEDARFIHIVRHPADACSSVLNVRWWPNLRLWNQQGETPESLAPKGFTAESLAAQLWVDNLAAANAALSMLAEGKAIHMRYEDLVARPAEVIDRLLNWLELRPEPRLLRTARSLASTKSVGSYKQRLTGDQIAEIRDVAASTAQSVGYEM